MELVGTDKPRQSFEELLAAAWAEQFARVHTSPGQRDKVASCEGRLNAQVPQTKERAVGSEAAITEELWRELRGAQSGGTDE